MRIVQFGAGAIGRGFLGQLWTDGGYEVVFVDIDPALVDALNRRRSYPLRLVDTAGATLKTIAPVLALPLSEPEAIIDALATCAFAATAVGANAFETLAPLMARGAQKRAAEPLRVIVCENQNDAARHLARAAGDVHALVCVDASVGRMVPPPTPQMLAEDPLLIATEPYAILPIDADAWVGDVPVIPGLKPVRPFAGYAARKLFTHNGGHALLAYEGAHRRHTSIGQCVEDPELLRQLCGFWDETGRALCARYGFDPAEQRAYEDDLLRRFANGALGDTVERVGRDPARKLRADDRLVGAALLCLEEGIEPLHIVRAIAAALRVGGYAPADLVGLAGLDPEDPLLLCVTRAYNEPLETPL